jgi:hypothetical protein
MELTRMMIVLRERIHFSDTQNRQIIDASIWATVSANWEESLEQAEEEPPNN